MAKKSGSRLIHKETGSQNKKQGTLPDEIALRDEILELKRQLMILKRTNEHYSVKLRKYEDEAKRKDRQLEQLMDPRKNSDITKVLSTKGAAILMNLKDQNNALIQMILNKDLHIRRLMAEIKMSKLYASTKKNEGYRAEISRLRNLLIKSQETLKENVDFHEQSRSICVSGNSFLEFSSSSDQSSPRDLEELRLTILSLESTIQQSNDLLAQKNQEISVLRDEINFLKKFSRYKTHKTKSYDYNATQPKDNESSTQVSTSIQQDLFGPTKVLSQDIINFFEKTINEQDEKLGNPVQNPVQDISSKWTSSNISIPKYNFHSYVTEETTEFIETNQKNIERVNKACSVMGKSLFHHLAADEIKREKKILSNLESTVHAKEKWKKALNKYKELKQLNPQMFSGCVQVEEVYLKYQNKETELSEEKGSQMTMEITPSKQIIARDICSNAEDKVDNSDGSGLFVEEKTQENLASSDNEASETCQSSEKESWILKNENYETRDATLAGEAHTEEVQLYTHGEKENTADITQNSGTIEEMEPKFTESQGNYFHSLDSSFDSDYGYSAKQEVQQVQVEVQINSVSSQSDSDQAGNNISETNQFHVYDIENNENLAPELDFDDDDDDVIIREK